MGPAPPGAEDRLRAAGALDFPGDPPAVFSFYVMIVGGPDVPRDAHAFSHSLAAGVVASLRGSEWHSKLDSLSLHPILMNPSLGPPVDYARHARNGNASIGIVLDFAKWIDLPPEQRQQQIVQCFAWGIRRIAASHLGDADRARVLEALNGVAARLMRRPFMDDGTSGPVTLAAPVDARSRVLKLYRFTKRTKQYWETWRIPNGGTRVIHSGKLGTRGKTRRLGAGTRDLERAVGLAEARARKQGFTEIPPESHARLVVELPYDGRRRKKHLEWRHRCEDLCNETLGWSGLGHCEGGDSGGPSMRVFCSVVDYPLAAKALRRALDKGGFGRRSKLFELDD